MCTFVKGRAFVWSATEAFGVEGELGYIPIAKVQAHKSYVTKCLFSPSSDLLATTSADNSIKIWEFGSDYTSNSSSLSEQEIRGRPNPDKPTYVDQDDSASHTETEDSEGSPLLLRNSLEGHLKWVWDCAWSADSEYLVSASSDNTARLWSAASGDCVCIYTGHLKALTSVALNDFAM